MWCFRHSSMSTSEHENEVDESSIDVTYCDALHLLARPPNFGNRRAFVLLTDEGVRVRVFACVCMCLHVCLHACACACACLRARVRSF